MNQRLETLVLCLAGAGERLWAQTDVVRWLLYQDLTQRDLRQDLETQRDLRHAPTTAPRSTGSQPAMQPRVTPRVGS
jgi:hypothetical protein